MKIKMLLITSLILNVTLLGAVTYLSRQIPDLDAMATDARVVANGSFDAASGSTSPAGLVPRRGTVVETLLPIPREAGRHQLLDIETGRCLTEPDFEDFGRNAKANIAWIRANGLDLSAIAFDETNVMCIGYYLAAIPVAPRLWEEAVLAEIGANPELVAIQDPKRTALMPERCKTDTFLFRTSDGAVGVLQILGATADRRNVRIRYKLAPRALASPAQSVVLSTDGVAPQPGSHP